jgi:hypothetical protein
MVVAASVAATDSAIARAAQQNHEGGGAGGDHIVVRGCCCCCCCGCARPLVRRLPLLLLVGAHRVIIVNVTEDYQSGGADGDGTVHGGGSFPLRRLVPDQPHFLDDHCRQLSPVSCSGGGRFRHLDRDEYHHYRRRRIRRVGASALTTTTTKLYRSTLPCSLSSHWDDRHH